MMSPIFPAVARKSRAAVRARSSSVCSSTDGSLERASRCTSPSQRGICSRNHKPTQRRKKKTLQRMRSRSKERYSIVSSTSQEEEQCYKPSTKVGKQQRLLTTATKYYSSSAAKRVKEHKKEVVTVKSNKDSPQLDSFWPKSDNIDKKVKIGMEKYHELLQKIGNKSEFLTRLVIKVENEITAIQSERDVIDEKLHQIQMIRHEREVKKARSKQQFYLYQNERLQQQKQQQQLEYYYYHHHLNLQNNDSYHHHHTQYDKELTPYDDCTNNQQQQHEIIDIDGSNAARYSEEQQPELHFEQQSLSHGSQDFCARQQQQEITPFYGQQEENLAVPQFKVQKSYTFVHERQQQNEQLEGGEDLDYGYHYSGCGDYFYYSNNYHHQGMMMINNNNNNENAILNKSSSVNYNIEGKEEEEEDRLAKYAHLYATQEDEY